jgi:SAM-dependent methyltransferase
MIRFDAGWLALREPADIASRSEAFARQISASMANRVPARVLDLGAGTGSNFRYLSRFLPDDQRWLLTDHDAELLTGARREESGPNGRLESRIVDLANIEENGALFENRDLVTASALLDLVSDAWLRRVCERCRALTYDGCIRCTPVHHFDETIAALVNRHQRSDKGFGPALGPGATTAAANHLWALGYEVGVTPSNWNLTPDQHALQRELIGGWSHAAAEMRPDEAAAIDAWRLRRLTDVDRGRSFLTVGHQDLIGLPG